MASAPLSWLLKIGADALNTTAKTISGAVNELLSATNTLNSDKADKATVNTLSNTVNTKVAKTDLLTLEEITASTSLTDKGASAESVKSLNASLGGCSIEREGEAFFIVGADSVRKKLGEPTVDALKLSGGNYTATKAEKVLIDWGVYGNNNYDGGHNNGWINLNIKLNDKDIIYETVRIKGDRAFGYKEGNLIKELKAGDKITTATSNNVCNIKSSVRIISIP